MKLPPPHGPGLMEWLVVGALLLIFVGPDRMPTVARWLGRRYGRLRRLMSRRLRPELGELPPDPRPWDRWDVVEAVSVALILVLLSTWIGLLAAR